MPKKDDGKQKMTWGSKSNFAFLRSSLWCSFTHSSAMGSPSSSPVTVEGGSPRIPQILESSSSHLIWIMGTELGSSGRESGAPDG